MDKLYNYSNKIMSWFYYLKHQKVVNLDGSIFNVSTIIFRLRIKSNKNYFRHLPLFYQSIKLYKLGDESEWAINRFKILRHKNEERRKHTNECIKDVFQ